MGPKQRSRRKKENDKRAIQSEKSMKRSMLIEVTVDGSNGLTSFRADRLDMRRP